MVSQWRPLRLLAVAKKLQRPTLCCIWTVDRTRSVVVSRQFRALPTRTAPLQLPARFHGVFLTWYIGAGVFPLDGQWLTSECFQRLEYVHTHHRLATKLTVVSHSDIHWGRVQLFFGQHLKIINVELQHNFYSARENVGFVKGRSAQAERKISPSHTCWCFTGVPFLG